MDIIESGTGNAIIIGDLNSRIGIMGERDGNGRRSTRDTICNAEGKKWVEIFESMGMSILNGNAEGDLEGEYTSVIDYAAVTEEVYDDIHQFTVEKRIESDHAPIRIAWRGRNEITGERIITKYRQEWGEKDVERYKEGLYKELTTNSSWKDLSDVLRKHTVRKQIITRKNGGRATEKRKWFDGECAEARRQVKCA